VIDGANKVGGYSECGNLTSYNREDCRRSYLRSIRQSKKRRKSWSRRHSWLHSSREYQIYSKLSSRKVIEYRNDKAIGEDPKTVLCVFFKAGQCEKGKKCKFSHDMSLDGKASKIDLYSDPRDRNGRQPERTDIICQHFLDAVEKNLYGWFWECPNNGNKCVYTHALPQGYVLERERKEMEKARLMGDDDDELTLEEKIEEERAALPSTGLTPVTLASFQDWKVRKAQRK
jgi:hypothetical protein